MADLFREQEPRLSVGTIRFTDRKLLRKIREKKIAMGHRPDDHEEISVRMGLGYSLQTENLRPASEGRAEVLPDTGVKTYGVSLYQV